MDLKENPRLRWGRHRQDNQSNRIYGTEPVSRGYHALRTWLRSFCPFLLRRPELRRTGRDDKASVPVHIFEATSPSLRVAGFEDSLSDEAQALSCRPLKSASQARRAPQPGCGRSRKDEDEYEVHGEPSGYFSAGARTTEASVVSNRKVRLSWKYSWMTVSEWLK